MPSVGAAFVSRLRLGRAGLRGGGFLERLLADVGNAGAIAPDGEPAGEKRRILDLDGKPEAAVVEPFDVLRAVEGGFLQNLRRDGIRKVEGEADSRAVAVGVVEPRISPPVTVYEPSLSV